MQKGFTLAEILIATAIMLVIAAAVANFSSQTLRLNRDFSTELNSEFEARKALKQIAKELRMASAFEATSTDAVRFTVDLDDNGSVETVRYFLDVGNLWREAGGLTTRLASVSNSSTTPIFNYNGRFIEITLKVGDKTHLAGVTTRTP